MVFGAALLVCCSVIALAEAVQGATAARRPLVKRFQPERVLETPGPEEKHGAIPFYMYDDLSLIEGHPPATWLWYKGLADWAIYEGLRNHPWRTNEPEKAKLFFVPGYLSAAIFGFEGDSKVKARLGRFKARWNETRPQIQARFAHLAKTLQNSASFQKKRGRDHFISGHWYQVAPKTCGSLGGSMKEMWLLAQDQELRGRKIIPVPYGDALDDVPDFAPKEFRERKHTLGFIGQADARQAYKERQLAITSLGAEYPDSILVCVEKCSGFKDLPSCSPDHQRLNGCRSERFSVEEYARTLQETKFGLMLPGDTSTSGRLYDFIAAEVIPIIVSRGSKFSDHAMPFREDLPWSEFAFMVDSKSFEKDPKGVIRKITGSSAETLDQKLCVLQEIRTSLDWLSPAGKSRVPSLTLRAVARATGEQVAPLDWRKMPEVQLGIKAAKGLGLLSNRTELSSPTTSIVAGPYDDFWAEDEDD